MQATSKEIYEQVAEKHQITQEQVKFVGNILFMAWADKLKSPKNIILKIKKLGRMYMRKSKLETQIEKNKTSLSSDRVYQINEEQELKIQRELEIYRERLQEYNKYVEKKKEIQALRYPHQPLLTPTHDPDRED